MADITNPQAIAFTNQSIRPLCEKVRALKAEIDDATTAWFGGINTTIGSSANDTLHDGREDEGISRLTGDDITAAMVLFLSIQTTLDGAGAAARIQKPCVRPIEAS
jgi:hypothetical protein